MGKHDYIVVGAGSAGCVLASRLSEDPACRVLLLEAGGRNRHLYVRMPAAGGYLFGHPSFDWGYFTEPQAELDGRRIYWPRGKGLGGSSAINGMIFIRGNARDYDGWRQLGLEGWAYADVLPYFRRAEGNLTRDDAYHGPEGRLRTGPAANFGPIDRLFLEAAEQSGLPLNPDFNGKSQIGAGRYDLSVHRGRRWTSAVGYLDPARRRPNLAVVSGALVHKIRFDGTRAVGVEYLRGAERCLAEAAEEVVLSLGAINSPQLLMLSGVGAADDLRVHHIRCVADVPGVGRNLQDHLNIPLKYVCRDERLSTARYQRADRMLGVGLRYVLTRTGLGAAPFWSVGAFKATEPGSEVPDLQMFLTPMVMSEDARDGGTYRKRVVAGFQLDVNQMHPAASGHLKLRSADPREPPIIEPAYLSAEKDRRDMVEAVKWGRELAHQRAFDAIRGDELAPGAGRRSDAEILAGVRRGAISGYHPSCTCKMGVAHDPMAVVDAALRVRGVERLRVVDASVMPAVTTGNTNAPTIMIAEKAADLIRGIPPLPRAE